MEERAGAPVERGRVIDLSGEGARVESLSREGITSPPLPVLGDENVEVGDFVYFFLFGDGTGMILGRFDVKE